MEYLTVAEFAAAAGVSTQAVYKRLPTIAEFVNTQGNKKTISTEALQFFGVEQPCTTVDQQVEDKRDAEIDRLLSLLENAQRENSMLTEQLVTLSAQIANLANSAQILAVQSQALQLSAPVQDQSESVVVNVAQPVEKEPTEESPGWLKRLYNKFRR